jgi:NAD(P)H-dependent FMN reductase
VLKNAIDWVHPEWTRKAAGFVSYGSAVGARSVQQLRDDGAGRRGGRMSHSASFKKAVCSTRTG